MSAVTLVFPHQLFESNPAVSKSGRILLIEEFLFFKQYRFHKQKLVFHRATMKCHEAFLRQKQLEVQYIESRNELSDVRVLIDDLAKQGVREIHLVDVIDNWLEKRIIQQSNKHSIKLVWHESPMFMLSRHELDEYFGNRKTYFQTDFYIQQRKRFNILMDGPKPVGGKWTFDAENRLKYPKAKRPPLVSCPAKNVCWLEAENYVQQHFSDNYGLISGPIVYPTTYQESRAWLQQFLEIRFQEFGAYEDALVSGEHVLHHSALTPMLNVGLLTPHEVLSCALQFAEEKAIPINSLEGFIRQIAGWREFIRGVYVYKGTQQRTTNFWQFNNQLPASFWKANTGLFPVDSTIKKVLKTAYCHHIERLMVLGNVMLLGGFHPDSIYQWFMEMFIDAYDWVMVPNVYGMSQFADGGLMATKPYISGSNYLMKMSNYPKGDWQATWDALFWCFMDKHRTVLAKNPRLGMLIKTYDKQPQDKKNEQTETVRKFIQALG